MKKILLIGNMKTDLSDEFETIRRNGHKVIFSAISSASSRLMLKNRPDMIIAEISKSCDMDAISSIGSICKTRNIPMLLISDHIDETVSQKNPGFEPCGYICKNCGKTVLLSTIETLLSGYESDKYLKIATTQISGISSTERLKNLALEAMSEGVIITDKSGKIIYSNTAAKKILKTTVNNTHVSDPADAQCRNNSANTGHMTGLDVPINISLKEGKTIKDFIQSITMKNGKEKNLSASSSPIFDENCNITGAVVNFRDISETVKIESKILESRASYQLVIDSIDELLSVHKCDGTLLFVNAKTAEMLAGEFPEKIIGKNISEFIPKEDADKFIAMCSNIIKDKTSSSMNIKMKFKSGERWLHNHLTPIEIGIDNTPAVLSVSTDITEKIKIEEELQMSRKVFNFSLDMLCISTFDGYFKFLNPACVKMLGWEIEELLSKPWIDFVHPDDRSCTESISNEMSGSQRVFQFENRFICKNGTVKWLAWNSYPCIEEKMIFGVARDITEKKMDELYHNLANESLKILNSPASFNEIVDSILSRIMKESGSDFAAMHIEKDSGEPYFRYTETSGNPKKDKEFIFEEPVISMQKAVQSGNIDKSSPVFTGGGSFHTNNIFIVSDYTAKTGNRHHECSKTVNHEYASVAIIPIKTKDRIFGFIHIANRIENAFPPEMIRPIELMANYIAESLLRKHMEDRMVMALQESDMLRAKAEKLNNEKEMLLHEVHHRIKNNMNTISGILTLQASSVKSRAVKDTLREATGRIQSMMILYDKLYRSEDITGIPADVYLKELVGEITAIFPNSNYIKTVINISNIVLNPDILSSLGMIINELITNSMKHAFTGSKKGRISITTKKLGNNIRLIFENDGIPISENVLQENSAGFGMQFVSTLVKQINGSISIERGTRNRFIITFNPHAFRN